QHVAGEAEGAKAQPRAGECRAQARDPAPRHHQIELTDHAALLTLSAVWAHPLYQDERIPTRPLSRGNAPVRDLHSHVPRLLQIAAGVSGGYGADACRRARPGVRTLRRSPSFAAAPQDRAFAWLQAAPPWRVPANASDPSKGSWKSFACPKRWSAGAALPGRLRDHILANKRR